MIHLPNLVKDLALILGCAGVVTLIFRVLKQPVVLGYILVGLLVGPHVAIFPTIIETSSIKIWAEIGVIFLMFGLGLEFSFKKLMRVGRLASVTAIFEISAMLLIGFLVGQLLHWSTMDSIFLGGMLSISSTTIILRAFEEQGVKSQKFAHLVFGVLIIEDVVVILLLVLLSTLAISQKFEGIEMLSSMLKLLFFLLLWFVAGIALVPPLIKRVKKVLSDETLLVISLGLCLLMVMLATSVSFSPALGAFIMGSILAETTEAEKIEHLIRPVKDLFAAIFFVSVGMLIDPKTLVDQTGPVLLIALVTLTGRMLSPALGALISGQPLKHSVQAGMSMAQIGEFSFIIAVLGDSLRVTSSFLYPIVVAVSAITTFTTPYMIRAANPVYAFLEKNLPQRWLEGLTRYRVAIQGMSFMSKWRPILKPYLTRLVINTVIVLGIFLTTTKIISPLLSTRLGSQTLVSGLCVLIALFAAAPFLWALVLGRPTKKSFRELWNEKKFRAPLVFFEIIRIVTALFLIAYLLLQYMSAFLAITTLVIPLSILMSIFSQNLRTLYHRLEEQFLYNLNEREVSQKKKPTLLAPWDAHLASFTVSPHAECVGHTLLDLSVREKYGVTIALIERGSVRLTAPGAHERLFPFDQLAVLGTDEHLVEFKKLVEEHSQADIRLEDVSDYSLEQVYLDEKSPYVSKSIRDCGIRERTYGLVVGVERKGERILNPHSNLKLEIGDLLWIVGDKKKIKTL